jgi:hypothetical protein
VRNSIVAGRQSAADFFDNIGQSATFGFRGTLSALVGSENGYSIVSVKLAHDTLISMRHL